MQLEILTDKTKGGAISFFYKIIEAGIDFKLQQKPFSKKNALFPINTPLEPLPQNGLPLEEVLNEFNSRFLPYCINFSSPNFLEYPYAGNAVAAIGADFLKSLLNQNLMTSEWSPAGTYLEIQTINWLRNIIGYNYEEAPKNIFEVGGMSTVGGTFSNAVALYAASKRSETLKDGDCRRYIFIPKGISHYSIKRSLDWLGGIGEVLEVETKNFKYDLNDLLNKLEICGRNRVLAVVAFAGDSKTVSIDNFVDIYRLVNSFDPDIWLHTDACHGFCLAFSNNLRSKLQGINLFDSISADPHKDLLVPYPLSFLLFKDPKTTRLLCEDHGNFLDEDEMYNFGRITPFVGSKSWETLKFWFLLKNLGVKGIGKLVDKLYETVSYFLERIASSRYYYPVKRNDFNSVLFSHIGEDDRKSSDINEQIIKQIEKDGIYALKPT
ncbi:MAG: pyridoxal-dependent decarboxylase, partial [Candidatus Jordarchaeaceae archaeon]